MATKSASLTHSLFISFRELTHQIQSNQISFDLFVQSNFIENKRKKKNKTVDDCSAHATFPFVTSVVVFVFFQFSVDVPFCINSTKYFHLSFVSRVADLYYCSIFHSFSIFNVRELQCKTLPLPLAFAIANEYVNYFTTYTPYTQREREIHVYGAHQKRTLDK